MTHHIINPTALSGFMDIVRRGLGNVYGAGRGNAEAYEFAACSGDAQRVIEGHYTMEQVGGTARKRAEMTLIFIRALIQSAGNPFAVKFGDTESGNLSMPNPALRFGHYINFRFNAQRASAGEMLFNISADMRRDVIGEPQEGDSPSSDRSDIVVTPLTGWAAGYVNITPSAELLAGLPQGMRSLAVRAAVASTGRARGIPYMNEAGTLLYSGNATDYPTGAQLVTEARTAYREMIRARLGRPWHADLEAESKKREEHRVKTKANFEAFVRNREKDTDQHINKLPFVPHGLAASRRWGIEVESGGARGVATPKNWEAKGDGSLRSAYDGYVEVQDFEPYDEEVTETIRWQYCRNSELHTPSIEVPDDVYGYITAPNPDYMNPQDCEHCGHVTTTVRREPQTIRHEARGGDCREFVSPILTSMHSNGLEAIVTALSKNPQNDSAGVHVHVEASDLSKQQIATMVYGYDILEPILEASYRRNRRDFCERRDAEEVLRAARAVRGEGVQGNEGGRYRTLNTHSLSNHGTLEFRAMGPVYEYDYLVRWAMLCRELVNSVANGAKPKDFAKIKNWDDLTAFLAKFGQEYIRAAVYEMTGEVGEAAKLEKAGEPVTTEALDLDLTNLLTTAFTNVSASAQRMAQHVTMFTTTYQQASERLVGSMSLSMSEI